MSSEVTETYRGSCATHDLYLFTVSSREVDTSIFY